MSIDPNLKRGSGELAILSVLLAGPLHGYEIARRIADTTDGALTFDLASLYPLLYRMERDKWLEAFWEEGPNQRRRRSYRLTALGRKQLKPLRAQWQSLFMALEKLAGCPNA
jgi:DNA-binding PadR family transcriptional regulator